MSGENIIDWTAFAQARGQLGADFVRIVGYFREDGAKSVRAIEEAMRAKSAVALVLPAHTLKGEAAQFGATPLSELAEQIEMTARRCIESHDDPDELLGEVVRLRPLFAQTMELFERELSPLRPRAMGFGPEDGVAHTSVIPAKAGITERSAPTLERDPGFRRDDERIPYIASAGFD